LEELLYKYTFSESFIDKWEDIGEEAHQFLSNIQNYVHEIVRVRNKLFKQLREMENYFYNCSIYQSYTRDDMKQLIQLSSDLKGSDITTPNNLWHLKLRTESKILEDYEDSEYSDVDKIDE